MTLPSLPVPTVAPKMELPAIHMKPIATIFDYQFSSDSVLSHNPQTFEELKLGHGFVLYSHLITENMTSDPLVLHIDKIADRAQVFVDKVLNKPLIYLLVENIFSTSL
jgi:beta-galactosidase